MMAVVAAMLLTSLADWAEQDLGAYPFKQEDWLRYLLPSEFPQHEETEILLTGPSTVRENLRVERFGDAFPGFRVFNGGISLGTIDDVVASLQYVEAAYGKAAMPDILVMGISPRFIANIPATRPFVDGINTYSPYYTFQGNPPDRRLVSKSWLDALEARFRFLYTKQPERFRTAVLAVLNHWGNGPADEFGILEFLNHLFRHPLIARSLEGTRFQRALNFEFSEVLAWLVSPYKYSLDPPVPPASLLEWANEEDSWWRQVFAWDPRETAPRTRASLDTFMALVRKHEIRLLVVNMPERDISRAMFQEDRYQAYLDLVREATGDNPFLDLREFLLPEEFHDLEHSVYRGSIRLTDKVISFMKSRLEPEHLRATNHSKRHSD